MSAWTPARSSSGTAHRPHEKWRSVPSSRPIAAIAPAVAASDAPTGLFSYRSSHGQVRSGSSCRWVQNPSMLGHLPRKPRTSRGDPGAADAIAAISAVESSRATTTRDAPALRRNATAAPLNAENRVLAWISTRRNFRSRRAAISPRSETITPRTPRSARSATISSMGGSIRSGTGEAFAATWTAASRNEASSRIASSSPIPPTLASGKLRRLQATSGPNASDQKGGTYPA